MPLTLLTLRLSARNFAPSSPILLL